MIERRKDTRHNLILYLRVFDRDNDKLIGHVVDVSSTGMMMVSDDSFAPRDVRKLRIMLPYSVQSARHMDVDVECRWCGPDANDDFYDTGFRFLNSDAVMRETIDSVVQDVGFAA